MKLDKLLKESFELLMINTADNCVLIGLDLAIITFNKRFKEEYLKYLGLDVQLGDSILKYAQPERVEYVKEIYNLVFKGETHTSEIKVDMPNNIAVAFKINYKPARDFENRIVGAFVTIWDISDSKKVKSELAESKEKYRALINHSINAIIISTPDGNIVEVNAIACEMFNYTIEEFEKLSIKDLIKSCDKSNTSLLPAGLDNYKIEAIGLKKKAEQFPCEISSVIFFDSNLGKKVSSVIVDISSFKTAIEGKQRTEKLFKSLVENSYEVISLTDINGNLIYISPSVNKILGYDAAELLGKPARSIMHPDYVNHSLEVMNELIEKPGQHIYRINRFLHKDGHYIWAEGEVTNLLHDPHINAIVSNYRDITHRKEAEERIKESESNLKTIFDNTSEGFILVDKFGIVKSFNSRSKLYVLQNAEVDIKVGDSLFDYVEDSRQGFFRDVVNKVLLGETIQYTRLFDINKYESIWLNFIVNPIKEGKEVTGYCITSHDVTIAKKEEERLKLLESVITNSSDSVVITEAEPITGEGPKIIYVNEAFTKMTGYTFEEVIGKTPRILQGPNSDRKSLIAMKRDLEKWKISELEVINYKKNGEEFWVNMSIAPVANKEGWYTHWIAIERDVTERKKHEDSLVKQNLKLQDIAWKQSHMVRAPLARIMGLIELFGNTEIDEISNKEILEMIKISSYELDSILRDIVNQADEVRNMNSLNSEIQ